MSVLSWGIPTIEKAVSTNGAPEANATWDKLPTPKKDTTKLTTESGEEVVAQEEGGGIVDIKYGANSSQLEFDLFVKKGEDLPFEDVDGVIPGEFAFRLTPEDRTTKGFLIERAVVRIEENYSSADGIILHVVVRALKPASGKTVKPYIAVGA